MLRGMTVLQITECKLTAKKTRGIWQGLDVLPLIVFDGGYISIRRGSFISNIGKISSILLHCLVTLILELKF